jgi:hypothetical protein
MARLQPILLLPPDPLSPLVLVLQVLLAVQLVLQLVLLLVQQ